MSQSVKSMSFTHSLEGSLNPPLAPPWPMPLLSPRQTPPLTATNPNHQRTRCVCLVVLRDCVCSLAKVYVCEKECFFFTFSPFPSFLLHYFCFLTVLLSFFFKLCHSSSPADCHSSSSSSSSSHLNPRPLPKTPSVHWPENMVSYRDPSPLPDSPPPPLPVKKHHHRHRQVMCVRVWLRIIN